MKRVKRQPAMEVKEKSVYRNSMDQVTSIVGKLEINGMPTYQDRLDFPMPPIRFREPTLDLCTLLKKERGDWSKLSKDEVETLNRYSLYQTISEMKTLAGCWKILTSLPTFIYAAFAADPPDTFSERKPAPFKRIAVKFNLVVGDSFEMRI